MIYLGFSDFGLLEVNPKRGLELRLLSICFLSKSHYVDFGGIIEEEGTFCGYTIPTRLRIGWYFGTERFESEGEFFRVTIDDAIYR